MFLKTIDECDKNEQFVRLKCGVYCARLLSCRHDLGGGFIDLIFWVLGAEIEKLISIWREALQGEEKKNFINEINRMRNVHSKDEMHWVIFLKGLLTSTFLVVMSRPQLYYTSQQILKLLKQKTRGHHLQTRSDLEKKLGKVQEMFKLTDEETEFCLFGFIASTWEEARHFFIEHFQCLNFPNYKKYLPVILKISPPRLTSMLRGKLSTIGIVKPERSHFTLGENLFQIFEASSPAVLVNTFFKPVSKNTLPLEKHLVEAAQTGHVLSILREKPKCPTHILIYGPPGTGKTTYARGVAKKLGIPAYEITRGDEWNHVVNRRAAIFACLNMTSNDSGSLIIVDEADNLLNTRGSWLERGETHDKAWLNQLMEETGTRMIWITNRINGIEDSVLRRFAFSLHFKTFSRKQRIMLWNNILRKNRAARFLSPDEITQLAGKYKVTAGAIDLAVAKAMESAPQSKENFYQHVIQGLNAYQTLTNSGMMPHDKETVEATYDLQGLNVKGNLQGMVDNLRTFDLYLKEPHFNRTLNMNLLFYGPPGTGKSELARYIGRCLDREITCKRASDLLNPFVGLTEKGIRQAFSDAENEETILVIDEADSMLFNRDRALRSWEVSFTNEFLAQMEKFRGILICTTNRLDDLDHATLRRFNHKIEFHYLTPEGNLIFYQRFLEPLTGSPIDQEQRAFLKNMTNLAPGDFKVIRDRFSFCGREEATHQLLLDALQEEARLKQVHLKEKKVGFLG